MLQTKRKVAGIIAAVATIFSALVATVPSSAAAATAAAARPTISSVALNDTTLEINVALDSATGDNIRTDG